MAINASDIEAGRAFVRLLLEDADFRKGVDNSLKRLDSFAKGALSLGAKMGVAGLAITAPMTAAAKIFANAGDELNTLSERFGVSVKTLSEFKFAAEQSNSSLKAVVNAMREMQNNGVDPRQFEQVASAIAAIEDPTERAQAAFGAFGKKVGSELVPMLNNLEALRNKAREMRATMDPAAARSAANLDSAFKVLKAQSEALAIAIGGAVAPAVQKAADVMAAANVRLIDFIQSHKGIVQVSYGLGIALLGLAQTLVVVGGAFKGATVSIRLFKSALDFLSKHPYLVVGTILATIVTTLAVKYLDLFTTTEDLNDATTEALSAQQSLASAMNAGTKNVDARTEALKRLTKAQRDAIEKSDAQKQEKEIKAEEKRLAKQARIQQIDEELVYIKQVLEEQASWDRVFGVGGTSTAITRSTKFAGKAKALMDERRALMGQGGTNRANPQLPGGIGGGFAIAVLPIRGGKGLTGFQAPPQVTGAMDQVMGPRGTFSGRLAPQIFGGTGGPVEKGFSRLQKTQDKALEHLKNLDRKFGIGAGFRVGIA